MTIDISGPEPWRSAPFSQRPIGKAVTTPDRFGRFPFYDWDGGSFCPLTELGCVLASAIWNGALLDPAKWEPWLAGLGDRKPWDGQIWIPMTFEVKNEGYSARLMQDRWFADPITAFHIEKYRATRCTVGDPWPFEVLETFFEAVDWRWRSVEEFYDAACARWRLRLPPLLYDFALGRTGTTSLSDDSWRRLIGMQPNARFRQAFVPRAAQEEFRAHRKRGFANLRKFFPQAARVFHDIENFQRRGVIDRMAASRRLCAEWLHDASRTALTPSKVTLLDWCVFRLRQKRSAKFRRGFAPSTMKYRLASVFTRLLVYRATDHDFVLDYRTFQTLAREAIQLQSNPLIREDLEISCKDLLDYLQEMEVLKPQETNGAGIAENTIAEVGNEDAAAAPTSETVFESDVIDDNEEVEQEGDADDEYLTTEDRMPRGVCADVVSETTFSDLLQDLSRATDAPGGVLVVAILAYRCGLRLNEIVGARIGDFVIEEKLLELQLDRSSQRWLKTFDSRRVLPLHVLLPPAELSVVRNYLEARLLLAEALDRNVFLLGPAYSRALADGWVYEKYINEWFANAGYRGLQFRNFRHSFGSFALTNLLLPDHFDGNRIPERLTHSLSLERRDRLLDVFVGHERLGQASLHAVSQAMGHTGIQMTLEAYQHLLSFSLGLYVDRAVESRPSALSSANDDTPPATPAPSASVAGSALYSNPTKHLGYRRSNSSHPSITRVLPSYGRQRFFSRNAEKAALTKASLGKQARELAVVTPHHLSKPDWFLLFYLSNDQGPLARQIRRTFGIECSVAASWKRLAPLLAAKLSGSRKNEALTLPRGAEALWILNRLWGNLPSVLTAEERRLVGTFVWNFDKRNSYARFMNVTDAVAFREMLMRWGAVHSDIWIDEARGLNLRSSASRKSQNWNRARPDYDGFGAISIERDKHYRDSLGWSSDLKRHQKSKGSKRPASFRRHRHVVYAYKFFLAMVALREGIKPLKLPHANKVRLAAERGPSERAD